MINSVWITEAGGGRGREQFTLSIRTKTDTMSSGLAEATILPGIENRDELENHHLIGMFDLEDLLKLKVAIDKALTQES